MRDTEVGDEFRYLPQRRSEAAVKGSRSEPRSGRRPLTVRPSEGYVSATSPCGSSTLSVTAFR
jgi:hypothetical protein